jgi:hypothetical protein
MSMSSSNLNLSSKKASTMQPTTSPIVEENEEEEEMLTIGPLPRFPFGAPLGSQLNCWSEPNPADFVVRGANYLSDRKKIPSADFLLPTRGIDLFLTDACPENVGR